MKAMERQEEALDQGFEPDPINWREIWLKMNATWPDITWYSFREWCVQGIRITYARYVHQNCSRRTVWKLLKGVCDQQLQQFYGYLASASYGAHCLQYHLSTSRRAL